jgi:hypothetical protein
MFRLLSLASVCLLPACATVMEGTSQSVSIATTPPGASCNVDRDGTHLGTVSPTPGSINVSKSKNDITVSCAKEGYQPAIVSTSPHFVGTTFGNIVIGGLVGVAVDLATGADYALPPEVKVDLAANPPPPPGPTPLAMAPTSTPQVNRVRYD